MSAFCILDIRVGNCRTTMVMRKNEEEEEEERHLLYMKDSIQHIQRDAMDKAKHAKSLHPVKEK